MAGDDGETGNADGGNAVESSDAAAAPPPGGTVERGAPKKPQPTRPTPPTKPAGMKKGALPVMPPDQGEGKKKFGCSDHLFKRPGPSKAVQKLLEERDKEEAGWKTSKKVKGASQRLFSPVEIKRVPKSPTKALKPMSDESAEKWKRMFEDERDRQAKRAAMLRQKSKVDLPNIMKKSRDEIDDSVKRMYLDENAIRQSKRNQLLDKYVTAPLRRKLDKDTQDHSVDRLFREGAEKSREAAQAAFDKHNAGPSPKERHGKRSEKEWADTVSRLTS